MGIPEKNSKKDILCSSTHKLYIKYEKHTCNFVGHSKLKPVDCVALFNIQDKSDSITAIIASSTDAQRGKKIFY